MTGEEIAGTLGELRNKVSVCEHRIDDLEEAQKALIQLTRSVDKMANNIETMVNNQNHVIAEQQEHEERISKMENAPYENLKFLGKTAVVAAIGILVGAVLGSIGSLFPF